MIVQVCFLTHVPESLSYESQMKSSLVRDPWGWGVDLERQPGLWQWAAASTAVEGRARGRRSIHPDPIKADSVCSQCCNCSAFQKSFDIVNQTYMKCTSHMIVCRQRVFFRDALRQSRMTHSRPQYSPMWCFEILHLLAIICFWEIKLCAH